MLARIIHEYVELHILDEDARTKRFNMRAFRSIDQLADMLDYAHERLHSLGRGSSREVFVLSSSKALKIATNELGIEQNQNETEVSRSLPSGIVAHVKDHDDKQHRWIVSELVRPFDSEEQFTAALGLTHPRSSMWLLLHIAGVELNLDRAITTRGETNWDLKKPRIITFLRNLRELLSHGLSKDELEYPQQWGITSDGRIVVLDYGLSKELQKKHFGVAW